MKFRDVLEPETGIFAVALRRHENEAKKKLDTVQGWKTSLIKAANLISPSFRVIRDARTEKDFREKLDKVKRWKIALTKVANLAGHDSHIIRQESELVDKIVNDVWKRVKQVSPSVSDSLVGIDSQVEHIKALLLIGFSDVRILGIWGMGGIGKTTVAGAVFKQIACQFEGCCFLANIGKESEKSGGLTRLGEELLSKVLQEREVRINTPDIESSYFKDMLHRKKVLIVLDDVNNTEQLEFLAGDHCWFGTGSRIIITSRDKQVLRKRVDVMYEVKELNYSEALHLFSRNAFKQSNPLDDFVFLSNLVVRYARGNPLALKVLGSMLFDKSKIEWESALKKLEKGPQMNIQHVLKLSYDNLDEEEQHIFLHIACLFEGEDRDSVVRALDGCGFSTDIGIGLDSLPRELRYLYWDGYPLASLPANLPTNLVELNLPCSKVEMPWEGAKVPSTISQLNKLTVMSLKHSKNISSLPTNVDLPSLKTLDLYGCSNLNKFPEVSRNVRYLYLNETAIEEVPLSIECLSKLVILNMKSCTKLKCLPSTICKLKSLEIFILSGCTSLDTFPEILETMDHLQHLDLDETPIVNLSESICNLKALQVLDLSDCSKLENLPKNIKNLHFLEELRARGCNLLKLPAELKYLSSIVELNLSGNSFDRISADIEHLSKLRWLNVSSCKQLQSLPELPPRIKYVNARDCVSLESISGLKQLFEQGYSNSLTDETFVFTNCYKLDHEKWGDIVARAQLKIQHFAMGGKCYNRELYPASSVCFTYPASEIPEWFTGKSIGNSVTIQHLPPHWLNDRFLGFAVCVIVAFDDHFICDFPRGVISCKCNFENNYAGDSSHIFTLESWKYFPARSNGSKHVFLWYDCRWYDTIVAKSDWLNECWCNKVSFEFSAEILDCYIGANVQEEGNANCPQVEKCGVHPLYYKDE
ncbi:hypothetical protein MANES_10G103100v8 [Manihot esculenta]|uniref:Uncharacterized protein n=1 Tax=Manihot esculenta TaxID=3983 RepID=A0ACB7H2A2_MANES|nr:hypothetical protein MANES_10G103100v8 [Manihot esculenta]